MTKFRKFFTSAVMVMTVVVMSGLTAPIATNASAQAGDLIKKDGLSTVYYLGQDGKRYIFPNEPTFKSWYSDFSGVVTVSSDELASYPLGANVVMRPGTKLVKITTDPKVYAVEADGVLRHVQSEAAALALYGANWADRVIDVADGFFTNYTIGTPLASGEVPMGVLVQKTGESEIYYYDGSDYRLVEDEVAFLANRFQFANVLNYNTFTPSGSTITGSEAALIKTSQSGTTSGIQPGQGTGVTVALNSMTPAAQSVPSTVSRIPFTKFNVTASADGATHLESVTVQRGGLTTIGSGFFKVWVEKDGAVVASKRTLTSNGDAVLTFAPTLVIPAGQTISLDLLADVSGLTGNASLGINSASAVSAAGATVSGSFPMNGNIMSFTSYNVTSLIFNAATTTTNVKVGDEEVELGKFDVEFNANQRDVVFTSLTLRNYGYEDLAKVLMNVRLENNNEVVSENATFNGRYVTFTLKNGGLTMLKDDGNQTFYVKGDVIGKDVSGTPSLNLKLYKYDENISVHEKNTGFGATFGSPTNDVVSSQNIDSGALNVSKKSTSPSATTVIKGTNNVVALIANIKADELINADGIKVDYMDNSVGAVSSFQNIKVYVNNVLVDSFDTTATSASAYTQKAIDSSLSLNKGDNEVKVTVDVKSNAAASDKIRFRLQSGANLLDMPEYANNGLSVSTSDIQGTATGEFMTVEGGSYTVVRNDGYANDRPYVKGSQDVSLGKFAVKATNDSIRINSITLSANGASGTKINDTHVYDMKLFVDGVQIGTTRNFSSGATFSSLNYNIAKDATKVIELKGSFDSTGTGTLETLLTFSAQDSLAKSITPNKTASTTRVLVKDGGTLTVEKDANTPYANILIATAGVEQEVARFKLTSVDDSSNVTEFKIANVGTTTPTTTTVTDPRIASYKLYLGTTLLDTAVPSSGEATFYISGNKLVVPANNHETVSVKAVFNAITVNTETNKPLTVRVKEVKAKASNGSDIASGSITLLTPNANTMYLRKTKPTFAKVTGIVGGAGSAQEVARFTVAAADEDIRFYAVTFDRNGTGAASTSAFVLYEVGNSTALATSSNADFSGGFEATISKNSSKTFRVVANTASVAADKTFGLSLSDVAGTNDIAWREYFVSGYYGGPSSAYYNSTYVDTLPLDFGTMKY